MRIGVICEGPTDYPAIVNFLGNSLKNAGIIGKFRALFPEMDKTRPEGGWGNVLLWLEKYPPETRVQMFFSGGLFGGNLAADTLDAIIIHLDTDILDDASFCTYAVKKLGCDVSSSQNPDERAGQIKLVLAKALQIEKMTDADVSKHVIIPAVESTEAWCVAAFNSLPINAELLRGLDLTNAFMRALEASESKAPQENYSNIDKSLARRNRFCAKHAANSDRIIKDCQQFANILQHLSFLGGGM